MTADTATKCHLLSLHRMQENNGRIRNNGILRADSNQMWAVDGKQRICNGLINNHLLPAYTNHGAYHILSQSTDFETCSYMLVMCTDRQMGYVMPAYVINASNFCYTPDHLPGYHIDTF